jgi:hypothetical protein
MSTKSKNNVASVRHLVTKDDPIISYSITHDSTLSIAIGSGGVTSRVNPAMWRVTRTIIWNEGENGWLRKTKRSDSSAFKTEAKAQEYLSGLISQYGDDVRWKDIDPDYPERRYGYAGNWTIEQANGGV